MMKHKKVKKRGNRHAVEYKGDPGELPVDMSVIRQLDNYYQHFDAFTKHSTRK